MKNLNVEVISQLSDNYCYAIYKKNHSSGIVIDPSEPEKIIYLLGTLGDVNFTEAMDALKKFFGLEEEELSQIINEVTEFNDNLLKEYSEKA